MQELEPFVLHTINTAKPGQITPRHLTNMAYRLARCVPRRNDDLFVLLTQAAVQCMHYHDFTPRELSNTAWALAVATADELDAQLFVSALKLFEAIQQQNLVPGVMTYSALIRACNSTKQPEHVEKEQKRRPRGPHSKRKGRWNWHGRRNVIETGLQHVTEPIAVFSEVRVTARRVLIICLLQRPAYP